MGFQTNFSIQQAPAVQGDFGTNNPRMVHATPQGAFVVGIGGITVGRFVWIDMDRTSVTNSGTGSPDGFIVREEQGLIDTYLAQSSMIVPAGFGITVFREGDFFALNTFNASVAGESCYTSNTDGTIRSEPHGLIIPGYSETNFMIMTNANIGEVTGISSTLFSFILPPPAFSERITDDSFVRITDIGDIRITG